MVALWGVVVVGACFVLALEWRTVAAEKRATERADA
jgi:hypothetical protein